MLMPLHNGIRGRKAYEMQIIQTGETALVGVQPEHLYLQEKTWFEKKQTAWFHCFQQNKVC